MGHSHNHTDHFDSKSSSLYWAIVINVILTVVQLVGGILSGSLSLIADALHNFSDAGSLVIAAIARKVGKLPANEKMTYGYKRAEILGALINSTTLIIIAIYLLFEAVKRYFSPTEVDGLTIVWIAAVALVIDIMTAMLTFRGSKDNINIRAAFIHNVSDALASVVVIIAGLLIYYTKLYVVDLIATILISVYILYQSYFLLKQCISILMQRVPSNLNVQKIKNRLMKIEMVEDIHHVHLWQLDDSKNLFEAHIILSPQNLTKMELVKKEIRTILHNDFDIKHSTLEIEELENGLSCLDS